MTDFSGHPVVDWLGPQFARLHPLLQTLHREGGVLSGPVVIAFGTGLAGVIGRRLARRLGIPDRAGAHTLRVDISHDPGNLYWDRCFDAGTRMASVFVPFGTWPDGGWRERTGPVELWLGVDIDDGGWTWRLRGARAFGLPLPRWLLPRSQAGKRIVDGRYRFFVSFALPGLGTVLSYGGDLLPVAAASSGDEFFRAQPGDGVGQ